MFHDTDYSIGNGESPCTQCIDRGKRCTRTSRRKRQTANSKKHDSRSDHQNQQPESNASSARTRYLEPVSSNNHVGDGFEDRQNGEELSLAVMSARNVRTHLPSSNRNRKLTDVRASEVHENVQVSHPDSLCHRCFQTVVLNNQLIIRLYQLHPQMWRPLQHLLTMMHKKTLVFVHRPRW